MQRHRLDLVQRPAEPGGRQAEGRRRREGRHFGGRNDAARASRRRRAGTGRPRPARRRGGRAAPSASRIAASKGDGHGRCFALDESARKRQMTLAAEHEFGLGDQAPGLARPDPARPSSPMPTMDSHGRSGTGSRRNLEAMMTPTHSDPRRHHRSAAARRPAGRARPKLDVVLSLAGRTASPVALAGAGADRRLRRRARPGRLSQRAADRSADRRDASLRRADVAARGAGGGRDRACRSSRCCRPAWQQAEGDRWTDVDSVADAVGKLGKKPRRVFLALGRQELAPLRGRAAAFLSRAQRRSGRAAARHARRALHPGARAVRRSRRARAASESKHRRRRRQEQRRRRDLRQDRGGARPRHRGRAGRAGRRCQRRRDRRKRRRGCAAWPIIGCRPRKSAACRPAAACRRAR